MPCCPLDVDNTTVGFTEVSYENLHNVAIVDGVITRDGGIPGTSDAYADTVDWCPGTGCAMWVWTIDNSHYPPTGNAPPFDYQSNLINYYIYPEDGSTGVDGWGFSNQTVSFRRGQFQNSVGGGLIYYRNFPLGYNKFAIYYNNGTVWMLETDELTASDPGWIGPPSYARVGLPTTTRYRLRVTVKPDTNAQSSVVTQYITGQSPCGDAAWPLGPLGWSALGNIATGPTQALNTFRFDQGEGPTPWYIIPQLSDSDNELRSKSIKAVEVTGKITDARADIYGYDVGQGINMAELEAGENSRTGPIDLSDQSGVARSTRKQARATNSVLHTVRIEGEWDGEGDPDRIDEISYEWDTKGVRR